MNQKGFTNIVLIVISLAVIFAGTAGYFALRKSTANPIIPVANDEQTTKALPTSRVETLSDDVKKEKLLEISKIMKEVRYNIEKSKN